MLLKIDFFCLFYFFFVLFGSIQFFFTLSGVICVCSGMSPEVKYVPWECICLPFWERRCTVIIFFSWRKDFFMNWIVEVNFRQTDGRGMKECSFGKRVQSSLKHTGQSWGSGCNLLFLLHVLLTCFVEKVNLICIYKPEDQNNITRFTESSCGHDNRRKEGPSFKTTLTLHPKGLHITDSVSPRKREDNDCWKLAKDLCTLLCWSPFSFPFLVIH